VLCALAGMSAMNTPGDSAAFARIAPSCAAGAPRMEQPAQGRPGCTPPAESFASGISPVTAEAVAAATHTAAFTARPAGIVSSTTITHLSRADRVGSPVRISSGSKPT
jgi:hypothetical protein